MIAPPPSKKEEDVIRNTLNAIGVAYSHLNDDVLVPSHIEAERTRRILVRIVLTRDENLMIDSALHKVHRRKSKGNDPKGKKEESPKPIWPPVRKHHRAQAKDTRRQKQLTPEQQHVLLPLHFRLDGLTCSK